MKSDVLNHPFIEQLCQTWQLHKSSHSIEHGFTDIGQGICVRWVCTKSPYKQIRNYISEHRDTIVIVFHDKDNTVVDLYAQSVLDDRPVIVHDLNWKHEPDFWTLNACDSCLAFIMELDRRFGRKRLERTFVTEFRTCYRLLSENWTGLSDDNPQSRNKLALHTLIRLLFIAFLEGRHALDNRLHFVMEESNRCIREKRSIYREFIQPLFFKTLNCPRSRRTTRAKAFGRIPFLNGGLFTPTPLEHTNPELTAPNEIWTTIFNKLFTPYCFRTGIHAQEDTYHMLDPMMIGHVFESLMSSDQRAMTGSFYTPMHIARQIVQETFVHWMICHEDISPDLAKDICIYGDFSRVSQELASGLEQHLSEISILDPSAGSGAFLQSAMEMLFKLRSNLSLILGKPYKSSSLAKSILAQNLYGVDILADATELCCLRLWLELIGYCDESEPLPSLPNLDLNIRCGDSLADLTQYCQILDVHPHEVKDSEIYTDLKNQYRIATGSKKQQLAWTIHQQTCEAANKLFDQLDKACDHEMKSLSRPNLSLFDKIPQISFSQKMQIKRLKDYRAQLMQWRTNHAISPGFSFDIHFAEIMNRGGFDLIVGNPPWFSLHTMPESSQNVLKALYQTAVSVSGKRSQSMDISALFVEKALSCVRPGGFVSMVLPNKLLNAPSYENFRSHVQVHAKVHECKDLAQDLFDAGTYPCSMMMQRLDVPEPGRKLGLPELLRPIIHEPNPEVRALLHFDSKLGEHWKAKRGICTGSNAIFVGEITGESSKYVQMKFKGRDDSIDIERALVHSILRGAQIRPYQLSPVESMIFPYDLNHHVQILTTLPPCTKAWLESHKESLLNRRTSHHPYYALSGCSDELSEMKVVWRDISYDLEASFVRERDIIPLNTVYYFPVETEFEGYLLTAYLNSSMVRAYCRSRAEHALNDYRRYFAWLIQDIPWIFGDMDVQQNSVCQKIVDLSRLCHGDISSTQREQNMQRLDCLWIQCLHQQTQSGSKRISHTQRHLALYQKRHHKAG